METKPDKHSVHTPLGTELSIMTAPEHLGEGYLLIVAPKPPKDLRRVEIYLDQATVYELIALLALKSHADATESDLTASLLELVDDTDPDH